MILKKEIKISDNFGEEYVESIIDFLSIHYEIIQTKVNVVEMDIIIFDYKIDGKKLSILSEGMDGTSLIGKKSIVDNILKTIKSEKPILLNKSK